MECCWAIFGSSVLKRHHVESLRVLYHNVVLAYSGSELLGTKNASIAILGTLSILSSQN